MKLPPLSKNIGITFCIVVFLACGITTPVFATNYYIAVNGNDNNNGLTTSTAWKSIAKAMSVAAVGAGDTIIVRNGTYTEQFNITKSGSSTSNLIIKSENPLGSTIDAAGNTYGINITGNYVRVDGFRVKNANNKGIRIDSAHHVTVTNCESFHNKASGIYGGNSDFLWIERNHVYDNAWGDGFVTSGISIHHPVNITGDTNTTTPRILIRWNEVHDNYQTAANPTDGAGIILDDLRCAQNSTLDTYEFPAVVEGNLTYLNGGPGLKLFSTKNLVVRNNTAFKNGRNRPNTTWAAEVHIINCDNVDVVNNIAVHDLLNPNMTAFSNLVQNDVTKTGDNVNIIWKNNLLYNYAGPSGTNTNFSGASVPTAGAPHHNKIDVTPGFIDASAPDFNFKINSGSNARNAGTIALGYANKDLTNVIRPKGSAIDIGCYEYVE